MFIQRGVSVGWGYMAVGKSSCPAGFFRNTMNDMNGYRTKVAQGGCPTARYFDCANLSHVHFFIHREAIHTS